MPTPTYYPVATFTASGGETGVTFSNIPTTDVNGENLLHLVMHIAGTASGNASLSIQFNNDSNTNYGHVWAYGDGAGSASSGESASQTRIAQTFLFSGSTANRINIFNYTSTDRYKTVLNQWATSASGVQIAAEIWRSTAAIHTINVDVLGGQTMSAGATINIFGLVT